MSLHSSSVALYEAAGSMPNQRESEEQSDKSTILYRFTSRVGSRVVEKFCSLFFNKEVHCYEQLLYILRKKIIIHSFEP